MLWSYADGHCTGEEKARIEALIAADPVWRADYEEILAMRQSLLQLEPDAPSMRFTANIMEKLEGVNVARPVASLINKKIIWGIAAFFILSLSACLIYLLTLPSATTIARPLNDIRVPRVEWSFLSSSTNVQIILGINTVLLLLVFDAWLRRRKNAAAK